MAEILVIDDQDRTLELCRRIMPEHEWSGPARSWNEAQQALRSKRRGVDLVLLDMHFDLPIAELLGVGEGADERAVERARRAQGLHILEKLRRASPDLPVVLMTAQGGDLERAADRHGAEEYTYFLNDEDLDARALRAQVAGILQATQGRDRDGPIFWGRSLEMKRTRARLMTLARGRLPVILGGPTGSGKSLIARHFIHERSGRKGRFVSIDLSTIPKDLVAAQLFGSIRGAYTGSIGDRPGAFEEADGGTLFLDEIGNLSEGVQRMLLTVLQEGTVTRIGDNRERKTSVKLVVATNEDLGEMVAKGRFRADLYMRLNPATTVRLPPLRERKLDLAKLLSFVVERISQTEQLQELAEEYWRRLGMERLGERTMQVVVSCGGTVKEAKPHQLILLFPERTMRLLRAHSWPGNLREFAMTIENAVMLSLAEAISAGRPPGVGPAATRADVVQIRPKMVRDLMVAVRTEDTGENEGGWSTELRIRPQDGLNRVAQDIERQYFVQLYLRERGDFAGMAQALLGNPDDARKVQLRFNQLGLKVRELKARLP